MIFGVLVGIALTVGVAYALDYTQGPVVGHLVNWDVVRRRLKVLYSNLQAGWSKLTNR
jgi:hypothetical protein